MTGIKDISKMAFVYVGTVLGAGFSTGQEVLAFFLRYREFGLLGIVVAGFLFCVISVWILSVVYEHNIKGFDEFTRKVFGKRFGKAVGAFITVFMFCGFCAMVSGSGAVLKEQFGVSAYLGMGIMVTMSFVIFSLGLKGILNTNVILSPLMLAGIVCISILGIWRGAAPVYSAAGANIAAAGSGAVYVSYNMLSAMVMIVAASREIADKKTAVTGGVLGGIMLALCLLAIYLVMDIHYDNIVSNEVPMLKIAAMLGMGWNVFYIIIVYAAMLTTAIACGYGVLEKINMAGKGSNYLAAGMLCILSIPLASFGFAKIVGIVYASFGYIGIVVIAKMAINAVCERKTKKICKNRIRRRINADNGG